jgi:signal transduction histidine kinase
MVLMMRYAVERAESVGTFHAWYVVDSVLAPALRGVDLSEPLGGATYERVDAIVHERVMNDGRAVRVKIWRSDGTIVYSDEPSLVGRRHAEEAEELPEVIAGETEAGISDLDAEENTFERDLADKPFYTYAPLRLEPGGPVVAIADYQDYAFIQADIDPAVRRIALIVVVELAVLYAAQLPIVLRASEELRRRNERLNELLQLERETVIELRDLHQKKDDFVAAASHELRTPLTSIVGSLATLKAPQLADDPAVRSEFLAAAERQTKRLQRLITNLLSAAHLEDERPVTFEEVDLATIVRAVVADLDACDRVRTDVPSRRPVITDPGRLVEVLTALIDNALKYSPEAEPVDVGASIEDERFRVWVTDRGIGIDPTDHAAIFERFHQLDQSATRRHGGLGLGLHLSRNLVDQLGGRIEVASAPGRGSTFTVALPMGRLPSSSAEPVRATAS